MDSIHDLGGRVGFGPIEVDEPEEAFHAPWEGRVLGTVRGMSRPADWSGDWFRHCRELIDPVDYLTRPYYDQWAQAYAAMLINSGVATVAELVSGHSQTAVPGLPPAPAPVDIDEALKATTRYDRVPDSIPRFNVGDTVCTVLDGAEGHTRLPAYTRGREGVVHAYHGAHVLPDANTLGDERAEHLYTICFAASTLWPQAVERRDRVYVDLWESYFE